MKGGAQYGHDTQDSAFEREEVGCSLGHLKLGVRPPVGFWSLLLAS